MIEPGFTDKDYKKLARMIASHERLKDKYVDVKTKPARKGKIFGKGGKDKKPKFDERYTVTFSDAFKQLVKEEKEKMI